MCFETKDITQQLQEIQKHLCISLKGLENYINLTLCTDSLRLDSTNSTLVEVVKTMKVCNSYISEINIETCKLRRLNALIKLQELEKEVNM